MVRWRIHNQGGFTLIELLLVFAISSVMLAAVIASQGALRQNGRFSDAINGLENSMQRIQNESTATVSSRLDAGGGNTGGNSAYDVFGKLVLFDHTAPTQYTEYTLIASDTDPSSFGLAECDQAVVPLSPDTTYRDSSDKAIIFVHNSSQVYAVDGYDNSVGGLPGGVTPLDDTTACTASADSGILPLAPPPPPPPPPLAAGEALPGMDGLRPAQYVHICSSASGGIVYITQGSPNCLAGDGYIGDYGSGVPRTYYVTPCITTNTTGYLRYVYIHSTDSCPPGTTSVPLGLAPHSSALTHQVAAVLKRLGTGVTATLTNPLRAIAPSALAAGSVSLRDPNNYTQANSSFFSTVNINFTNTGDTNQIGTITVNPASNQVTQSFNY